MNGKDMTKTAVNLDHVGFIVRDLSASAALVGQLGFVLTARADHIRTDAQGHSVPAGSAQHSIMLHSGYVELMQITDPAAGHQLASAPRQRHGLHVVALGTDDAVACHAGRVANGVPVGPVLNWSRQVLESDLHGTARFAYFGAAWTAQDPSYLCWVEHRTPQLLRNDRLLTHANGARLLLGIRYAGPRPAVQVWADQLVAAGAQLQRRTPDGLHLVLPNARIDILVDDQMAGVLPQTLEWGGADLHWLRAQCTRMGLYHQVHADGALAVDLTQELGLHWLFLAESAAGIAPTAPRNTK